MNDWLAATLGLLPPFCLACGFAALGRTGTRLVALQFASTLATFMLVALSFAFGQPSFLDLALTLALLTLPATLVFTLFLERWL